MIRVGGDCQKANEFVALPNTEEIELNGKQRTINVDIKGGFTHIPHNHNC